MIEMIGNLLSICVWGAVCALEIFLFGVILYCLYQAAGFWIAFAVFFISALMWHSEGKKIKEDVKYNIEHGIEPSQAEGINGTDFFLGWILGRLFK